MTNLTEKWKKGELPNGWYYVRLIRGEYRIDLYINGKNEWIDCPDDIIDTVVCEVPSYEEYQQLLSDQLAKNEGAEINAELEAENAQLKKWCEEFNALEVAKENTKLKELLGRANDIIKTGIVTRFDANITQQIDEVLGEKEWLEELKDD